MEQRPKTKTKTVDQKIPKFNRLRQQQQQQNYKRTKTTLIRSLRMIDYFGRWGKVMRSRFEGESQKIGQCETHCCRCYFDGVAGAVATCLSASCFLCSNDSTRLYLWHRAACVSCSICSRWLVQWPFAGSQLNCSGSIHLRLGFTNCRKQARWWWPQCSTIHWHNPWINKNQHICQSAVRKIIASDLFLLDVNKSLLSTLRTLLEKERKPEKFLTRKVSLKCSIIYMVSILFDKEGVELFQFIRGAYLDAPYTIVKGRLGAH